MIKHTPGPWSVVEGYYPGFKEVEGPSFKLSVVMLATDITEEDYTQRNADLHLIAAAPDLLAALECLLRDIDAVDAIGNYGTELMPGMYQAHKAIAKATGA